MDMIPFFQVKEPSKHYKKMDTKEKEFFHQIDHDIFEIGKNNFRYDLTDSFIEKLRALDIAFLNQVDFLLFLFMKKSSIDKNLHLHYDRFICEIIESVNGLSIHAKPENNQNKISELTLFYALLTRSLIVAEKLVKLGADLSYLTRNYKIEDNAEGEFHRSVHF